MTTTSNSTSSSNSVIFNFRSLFYLLTPSETYIQDAKDVPDFTKDVKIVISFIFKYIKINIYNSFNNPRHPQKQIRYSF